MELLHRAATLDDLPEILAIYNSTIAAGQATADTAPVSVESRLAWFDDHRAGFRPLWVAESQNRMLGWLSFSSFYGRPAYHRTAELSVYVHADFRGCGVGRYLLEAAIRHAPAIAVDRLLGFIFGHNAASLALFEQFGFEHWGRLPGVASIRGEDRDLVILGRKV